MTKNSAVVDEAWIFCGTISVGEDKSTDIMLTFSLSSQSLSFKNEHTIHWAWNAALFEVSHF